MRPSAQDAAYRLHAVSTGAQSARSTQLHTPGRRARRPAHGDRRARRSRSRCRTASRSSSTAHRARAPSSCSAASPPGARAWPSTARSSCAPGAAGTDSQQSLRGLLAGPGAEIDVRPQLEIYTDDVRCSHGATAGKLDDNMLFYLLSRGLEPRHGAAPAQVGLPRRRVCEHRGARSCGARSSRTWPASCRTPPSRSCCSGREPRPRATPCPRSTSSACGAISRSSPPRVHGHPAGVPGQRGLLAAAACR